MYDLTGVTGVTLTIIDSSAGQTGRLVAGVQSQQGGIIYLTGGNKLILTGGAFDGSALTGGSASSIYVASGADLTLSGAVKINGNTSGANLYLDGAVVTVGDAGMTVGADVHVTLSGVTGTLATGLALDVSQFFTADNGADITYNAGTLTVEKSEYLRVGYAEKDYSELCTKYSMGLGGYGNDANRICTGTDANGLDIEVLAVRDAKNNTALICSVEAVTIATAFHTELREAVAEQYSIPADNVIITSNHQHATPRIGLTLFADSGKFNNEFKLYFLDAVGTAVSQLNSPDAETTVRTHVSNTSGANYVRNNWVYGIKDNVFRGVSSTGNHVDPGVTTDWNYYFIEEPGAGDRTMQLVWFDRENLKDIVLANFAVHPNQFTITENSTVATSNFTGVFRKEIADKYDCYAMYITGAAGDMQMTQTSPKIKTYTDTTAGKQELPASQVDLPSYAALLASYVPELSTTGNQWIEQSATDVQTKVGIQTVSRNDEKRELWSTANQIVSSGETYRQQVMAKYTSYTQRGSYIYSVLHAQYIVDRYYDPVTTDVPVYAVSLGDIAFAGVPYEMFSADGIAVKNGNAHKMTIVSYLANGHDGYVPSKKDWEFGGYSCDITKYAQGSSTLLNNKLISILNEIAG